MNIYSARWHTVSESLYIKMTLEYLYGWIIRNKIEREADVRKSTKRYFKKETKLG